MRAPDQVGSAAKAWLIAPEQFENHPAQTASLASWLIVGNPPGPLPDLPDLPAAVREAMAKTHAAAKSMFHPAWDTWAIQVCHLRPVPGMPPAVLHYPEAEFEVIIAAIDPEHCPIDPDHIVETGGLRHLTPLDLVKQFDGCSDEQAARLAGLMVSEICLGTMSPDQDYRAAWERAVDRTVNCYKAGAHGSGAAS